MARAWLLICDKENGAAPACHAGGMAVRDDGFPVEPDRVCDRS
jgi:hypothetical protein